MTRSAGGACAKTGSDCLHQCCLPNVSHSDVCVIMLFLLQTKSQRFADTFKCICLKSTFYSTPLNRTACILDTCWITIIPFFPPPRGFLSKTLLLLQILTTWWQTLAETGATDFLQICACLLVSVFIGLRMGYYRDSQWPNVGFMREERPSEKYEGEKKKQWWIDRHPETHVDWLAWGKPVIDRHKKCNW